MENCTGISHVFIFGYGLQQSINKTIVQPISLTLKLSKFDKIRTSNFEAGAAVTIYLNRLVR